MKEPDTTLSKESPTTWEPENFGREPFAHEFLEGVRAFCEEEYGAARRRFLALLLSHPGEALLLAAVGHCYLHEGDTSRAFEQYERCEQAGGNLPGAVYNKAVLLRKNHRFGDARRLLLKLYENPPPLHAGRFYLGLFFRTTEELTGELALYLAQVSRDEGNLEEAREWYRRALERQPENITALQRLAELAILTRNYIEAIRHLEKVLEITPLEEDRINAHINLGIACYENGMLEDAINHLTWVLARSPANPSAIHNLNFIFEKEGILDRDSDSQRPFRFTDVKDGARPIFQLGRSDDDPATDRRVTIIGKSAEMLRMMRHARVAAASDSPVLVHGENGTGKELLAQAIALNSSRRDYPFIVVNCMSIPELVLESELFGHEKGAFTGARARKQGALELATGGTVFIDEISALSPRLQGRMLRAIRDGQFTPMGDTRPVPLNVRIIAATNRDLAMMVKDGNFREDLYYQLRVVPIEVPPLRARKEDIPLLTEYFLVKHARKGEVGKTSLPADDLRIMMDYDWPGNVRELENLVERAIVMGSQSNLYLEELARLRKARAAADHPPRDSAIQYPLEISLADLEKRHILSVLDHCGQNQRQAARLLGINPSTLWRKLKSYEAEK